LKQTQLLDTWNKKHAAALPCSQNGGISAMTESVIELYDEKVFGDEIPDAALEIAGSKWGDGAAASVTAAFCSGLDTCPSSPSK